MLRQLQICVQISVVSGVVPPKELIYISVVTLLCNKYASILRVIVKSQGVVVGRIVKIFVVLF